MILTHLAEKLHSRAHLPGRPPSHLYARGQPLILAHRGARTQMPENSLEAFRLGMDQGADGVELDVHLTADGQVVVFHDETLTRLGRPDLRVSQLTLDELKGWDIGGLVKGGPPVQGVRIPSLEEVLTQLPLHAVVNVELKGGHALWPDGLESAVLHAVDRAGASAQVVYSAFHPIRGVRLRRLAPQAWVGMLHDHEQRAPQRDLWFLAAVAPHALHPSKQLCTSEYVARAKALDLAVHVWTVNDPTDMLRLASLGVDAIITDVPDLAVRTLGRSAELRAHHPAR